MAVRQSTGGRIRRFTLTALCGLLTGGALAQPPELRVGHGSTMSLPWGRMEGARVVGGINHDIALVVAKRLGWKLSFVLMPQSKDDHADTDRDTDLRCGIDPSWTRRPETYHWSAPLFDISDLLIGHQGVPALMRLTDLPVGASIGTVRGYRYPTLELRFTNGQLKREDAPDQGSLLAKLARQRTRYAVVSPQALAWYQRHNPTNGLAEWRVTVQQSAYYCAVPQTSKANAAQILDAVDALQREGEIARIVASYGPR